MDSSRKSVRVTLFTLYDTLHLHHINAWILPLSSNKKHDACSLC